jgi:hypothetical protein
LVRSLVAHANDIIEQLEQQAKRHREFPRSTPVLTFSPR